MFLDNPSEDEDSQRLKNLLIFGFWATNEERDRVHGSWEFWIIIILILAVLALLA